jgi:hypothetical protein
MLVCHALALIPSDSKLIGSNSGATYGNGIITVSADYLITLVPAFTFAARDHRGPDWHARSVALQSLFISLTRPNRSFLQLSRVCQTTSDGYL